MSTTLQLISVSDLPFAYSVVPSAPPSPLLRASLCHYFATSIVQEGEFYAHSAAFGIKSLIPKKCQNTSFEAEEAAKELALQAAKKAKAAEKAKEVAKKSAAAKQAKVTNTKKKTHQKPANNKKETEQKASSPVKEDAPVTTPV